MVIRSALIAPKQRIRVPGSKSYSNRALLLAALAQGTSILKNALTSDDTTAMVNALKALGVQTHKKGDIMTVKGKGGNFERPKKELYLGNAGTATRFLTAALATCDFVSSITGNARMKERPIQDLALALEELGARIKTTHGSPPVTVEGPLQGGKTKLRGDVSSQFLSALLMAAPYAKTPVEITLAGPLTSLPYVLMTLDTMKKFGGKFKRKNERTFTIKPHILKGCTYRVEGDASSASYPFAIAALHGTEMAVTNVPGDSKQADVKFTDILKKMGCSIKKTAHTISVKGPKKLLPIGRVNLTDLPDAAMTVAILCSFAKGTSKLTGLQTLRVKETDRLHALATELKKLGTGVQEGKDYLLIKGDPAKLHPGKIETYDDHRMAMCFAVAGSKLHGMKIMNPGCVSKTYPDFWKELRQWGVSCSQNFPA